jgi:hypothetical protein
MYSSLEIVINNAAQTVRKPASFYWHLLKVEAEQLEGNSQLFSPLLVHSYSWNKTFS